MTGAWLDAGLFLFPLSKGFIDPFVSLFEGERTKVHARARGPLSIHPCCFSNKQCVTGPCWIASLGTFEKVLLLFQGIWSPNYRIRFGHGRGRKDAIACHPFAGVSMVLSGLQRPCHHARTGFCEEVVPRITGDVSNRCRPGSPSRACGVYR